MSEQRHAPPPTRLPRQTAAKPHKGPPPGPLAVSGQASPATPATDPASTAKVAPATKAPPPEARLPEPQLIVFGADASGKPHGAWFAASEAELATKAAGLMGMRLLAIATDEQRAAAL